MEDVRWRQRLQNLSRMLYHLESALALPRLDLLQKTGLIKLFEISFELSWKLIKDYLEAQGFQDVNTPRAAFKKGYEIGLLDQGHDWMSLLVDRNLTTHTYDEQKVAEVEILIRERYFPLLKSLKDAFHDQ
jgi:nucleotidyltransferase substrate binding protein (TIGR01987 family)